jgi:hypothetical protein
MPERGRIIHQAASSEISAAVIAVGIGGFEDGAQDALPIDWHDANS